MMENELLRLGRLLILASVPPAPVFRAAVPWRPTAQADATLFRDCGRSREGEDFGGGAEAMLVRAAALLKSAYNAQAPEALFGLFTPFLRSEISLPELRSAFIAMRLELGRMTRIAVPRPAASLTAEMPARFDYGAMTVLVTVDQKGHIDGLLMEQV